MAQATSQGNSIRALHSDGSQGSQPNLITVKDAARRLGVSKSTVYRFDRDDGPLRFIVDSRPILIENDSFETHLANIRRHITEPCSPADEVFRDCPQEEQPERIKPPDGRNAVGGIHAYRALRCTPANFESWTAGRHPAQASSPRNVLLPVVSQLALFPEHNQK